MVNESEIIMEDIKVGDKLKIFCYKHDGTLEHTSEEAVVLENNEEYLVCGNGRTKITEKDGRSHMTNEPAVLFFYKNHWFNIIGQLKKFGLFYYCNIATPYLIDENIIKYIDYDLDLRVFPDGGFRILDKNEYNYHKTALQTMFFNGKNPTGTYYPNWVVKYAEKKADEEKISLTYTIKR